MTTRTAADRREQARIEYDAYLATCPSRMLLATLSDKWVVLVLSALAEQPRRYSELRRRIAGVSQKMLTQTLRTLERDGLVRRTVEPTVPVTVTYACTALGVSLFAVVAELKAWAEEHVESVTSARADYDARKNPGGAPG